MAHWKAMGWESTVDAPSGIRVYRLTGVLTDSRDAYALGDQVLPEVSADGRGGAVIGWRDLRDDLDSDLYAQAVDSNLVWGPDGVLVTDAATPPSHPAAVGDGRGSAIVVWESGPVYAQRLDENGGRLWGDPGVALSASDGLVPVVVTDGAGGALVAWQIASFDDDQADLRGQSVRASGALRWAAEGIPICQASGAQAEIAATPAASGGAILMWRDARSDPFGDLYAQRLDSTGVARWQVDGVVVSDAPGFQQALAVRADGTGGAVATWADGRAGRHIYAQRVSAGGRLGGVARPERSAPPGQPRGSHKRQSKTPTPR